MKHPQNTPQMTITNFNYEGSYLPGLTCNMVVRDDLGRSTGRSTPRNCHLVVRNGNFTFLATIKVHIGRSTGRSMPPGNYHIVVKNGNFTCLSTIRVHIGRSTGRYIYIILGLQVTLVIMIQLASIFQIPLCIISGFDCNGSTTLCWICVIRCYRYMYGNINTTTFVSCNRK